MGVETLLEGQVKTIEDLQPVEEKPVEKSRRLYQRLQETPLWDPGREEWFSKANEPLSPLVVPRLTFVQLLGVLVENRFNERHAKERYAKLKRSDYYNAEDNFWLIEKNNTRFAMKETTLQLLDAWIESEFTNTFNLQSYETLKEKLAYNHENSLWYKSHSHHHYLATDQLLGIMLTGKFDLQKAKEDYSRLTKTDLYDQQSGLWNNFISDSMINDTDHFALDQLLGVLAQGMFDRNKASQTYKNLKNTPLFDSRSGSWINGMDEDQNCYEIGMRNTADQLLVVLVEKMFEEKSARLVDGEAGLPVVRRF